MAHISTAWLYTGLLAVLMLSQPAHSRPSVQTDINKISNHLKLTVIVQANHLSTGNYDIAFYLTNGATTKMLETDDWQIKFSLHNSNLLTRREFEHLGFLVKQESETMFKMYPKPGVFPGLGAGESFKITVKARGLSVFRQDIHPNFIIHSTNTVPKVILSTAKEDLSFVQLVPTSSNPSEDFSRMTAVQRTVMTPDVMDMERVPESIIIPPAKNLTISPGMPLLNLSAIDKFYVWADSSVSQMFINYFREAFTTNSVINPSQLIFVTSTPPANADKIYIQQTGPASGQSEDYYKLAIRPKLLRGRDFNLIHMSATSEKGLHNAVETLLSAIGLYDILPDMTVADDARFGHRSLSLDLAKNFFPVSTVKKVLRLMSMYKLNKLELILGDDYAWRLDIPGMPALSATGAKRCMNNDCLPPYLGSGPTAQPPGSGSFSINHLAEIIKDAASKHIEVIPRFNFLGGLLSAKKGSQSHYDTTSKQNIAEAERYYLVSPLPQVAPINIPDDPISIEGLLDPCRNQTYAFINKVISSVNSAYKKANVTLKAIHAGGDELTKFLGDFPSCKSNMAVSSTADALRIMIGSMQQTLSTINAVLHVNEEAIVDPATGDCLTISRNAPMRLNNLVAHFYKTYPGSPDDWNLSKAQFAYMDSDVVPYDPTDPTSVPDPLSNYTGQTKGLTSWILPYRCANKGYQIVLKPENFFALDQAYELDFDEPGNRKMKRFHIINMHRMMMYEPLNHYMNMDIGKDGYTFLQYRMCKLFPCETLRKPENVVGLTATLDTSVIRTEEMLWHMLLPRLLCFAEKAWRKGEHEDILKAEEPDTLVDQQRIEQRAATISMEINNLMNNIAYKESGRLDEAGFNYRVPTVGASIQLGLMFNRPPPYPLMVKADMPALEIQVRELNSADQKWRPLFEVDPSTNMMAGGYTFDFPQTNQRVELRAMSSGGRDETKTPKRAGRSTIVTGSTQNYLPREIPNELREGTCLPTVDPWQTEIDNVTLIQWRRILQNIVPSINEQRMFMQNRQSSLETTVNDYNTRNRATAVLPMVFTGIQQALAAGQNISMLPADNLLRLVYEKDMEIYSQRATFVENRYRDWQQIHLQCQNGNAQPTLRPEPINTAVAGQGRGQTAQTGVAQGMGGVNAALPGGALAPAAGGTRGQFSATQQGGMQGGTRGMQMGGRGVGQLTGQRTRMTGR